MTAIGEPLYFRLGHTEERGDKSGPLKKFAATCPRPSETAWPTRQLARTSNCLGGWFGFEAPPLAILVGSGIIVIGYLVSTELLKPLAVAQTGRANIEVNRTGLA